MGMSSSGIFSPDKNPAKALYRYWSMVLRGACNMNPGAGINFGQQGCTLRVTTLDERQRPVIAFGYGNSDRLIVRADGAFRIGYVTGSWGNRSRWRIMENSFLDFNHDFGQYHWHVNAATFGVERPERPSRPDGGKWYGYLPVLRDWRHPVPYVSEDFMGARAWNDYYKTWMVCEPDETFVWRIVPKTRQPQPIEKYFARTRPAAWTAFVEKREKRYRAARHHYEIDCGLRPEPRKRKEPVGITDDMLAQFAAAFDLSEPAFITPLKRPEEAQHGHNLAPEEQLHPAIIPAR